MTFTSTEDIIISKMMTMRGTDLNPQKVSCLGDLVNHCHIFRELMLHVIRSCANIYWSRDPFLQIYTGGVSPYMGITRGIYTGQWLDKGYCSNISIISCAVCLWRSIYGNYVFGFSSARLYARADLDSSKYNTAQRPHKMMTTRVWELVGVL